MIGSSLLSHGVRLIALGAFILSVNGCALLQSAQEQSSLHPGPVPKEIERTVFPAVKGSDVIGRLAYLRLERGDTLPDIARHFSLGITALSAANPGVDVWGPQAGTRVILPLSFILPRAPRQGIVVNLASMRLFHFKGKGRSQKVSTYPIGVGTRERPTPTGQMQVERKVIRPTWHVPESIAEDHRKKGDPLPAQVPPGPENPLGECALYLSKAGYLIHGTNKPASIGLKATNGCIRLYPEHVKTLYRETPVNTPVVIVDQPYLVGQRDGVVYLEAHTPQDGSGEAEIEKIFEKLRRFEKMSGRTLDWKKLREVKAEARGVPVPIFQFGRWGEKEANKIVELEHPVTLYGRPELPELRLDAWYLLAADVADEIEAARIAAIINHQGPPIPARVLSKSAGHRVLAGPFDGVGVAKDAARRLKIDLELDSVLVEPVEKR